MGGILSKPKMPDTSKAMKAQADAMAKQTELLDQQEARLKEKEKSAQQTARRRRKQGVGALIACFFRQREAELRRKALKKALAQL